MKNEFSRLIKVDLIEHHNHIENIEANEAECADLAKRFEIVSVDHLEAEVTIQQEDLGANYHIIGTLKADITQQCSVTAVDIKSKIEENFDAWFADEEHIASFSRAKEKRERTEESDEHEMRDEKDEPERVVNGIIDIGEVVAQYLGLAIDPYLHADGVEIGDHIEVDPKDAKANPFAKLAELKEKK